MKYLKYFPNATAIGSGIEVDLPNVSYLEGKNVLFIEGENSTATIVLNNDMNIEVKAEIDYNKEYFTITSEYSGTNTIRFNKRAPSGDLYYSMNGVTWTSFNFSTGITLYYNQSVKLKGNLSPYQSTDDKQSGIGTFDVTNNFSVSGNILSLLYGDNFYQQNDLLPKYTFVKLFSNCYTLTHANNLILSSQNLNESSYHQLFYECRNLLYGPEVLPATTLQTKCYFYMYGHCHELLAPPQIMATTTAQLSCSNMFQYCYKLKLPEEYTLPAMNLVHSCYRGMFWQCTALTNSPILPALTLVTDCYNQMFGKCSALKKITALFLTTPSSSFTYNWVTEVSYTGTFIKNAEAQWNIRGAHGIPSNWTVETISS